jgi:hypothetical protein
VHVGERSWIGAGATVIQGVRIGADVIVGAGAVIIRDDVPHFTEINARFGGGVPLGIAAGVDAPTLLLAHTFGLPFSGDPIGEYTTGLYLSRFDDSFFLTEEQREQVAGNEL